MNKNRTFLRSRSHSSTVVSAAGAIAKLNDTIDRKESGLVRPRPHSCAPTRSASASAYPTMIESYAWPFIPCLKTHLDSAPNFSTMYSTILLAGSGLRSHCARAPRKRDCLRGKPAGQPDPAALRL
jgi:hypothetical protein